MAKVDAEETAATLQQLEATDLELVRIIEDLIRVLADRDIIDEGALPIRIRRLLQRRHELRNSLPHKIFIQPYISETIATAAMMPTKSADSAGISA